MSWYNKTALVLANVGAINWGLTAFDWNLVNMIFGSIQWLETTVYVIVALCGLWGLYALFKK